MGYQALERIAGAVADRIRGALRGGFRQVSVTQATNTAQLWQDIPNAANLPACVVAVQGGDYEDRALSRNLRLMIVVATPFQRGSGRNSASVWELCDLVTALFLPRRGDYPAVCGIEFAPEAITPGESPEDVCVSVITLAGIEFLTEDTK